MTQPVRACLITNPRSGKGGIDLAPILPVLAAHGWDVEVRQKLHGGHATELAENAAAEGFDVVVACGGDGTVGEVVDGVVGTEIAVGVLPGGTANLWAHEIGVSMDLAEAALQLVGAQRRRVDVGRVTINGGHGQHFLLMAGLGIDASVLSGLNKKWKNRLGMLAYLPAIGRALPTTRPFPVHLDLDGVIRQTEAVQIVVGNTRRYASVTSVTPEAVVDDGQLDVCVLSPGNPLSAAQQISTLVVRKRPSPLTAVNDRVGHLTVKTTEVVPIQADGGRVKQKGIKVGEEGVRYDFTVRAHALTALVPRDYSGDLFQSQGTSTLQLGATVTPPAEPRSETEKSSKKSKKSKNKWYRVVSVGVNTLSAAREKDGRVTTIAISPKTKAQNAEGQKEPVNAFLAAITEGQRIAVEGKKEEQVLVAKRIQR